MGKLITSQNSLCPQIGDEVSLTEECSPMGLRVGDVVKIEDFKDGMIMFRVPNFGMGCWTAKFGPKIKQCVCAINDLIARGCTCGGQ